MSSAWLSFAEAAELIQTRFNTSIGRSEALVRQAEASREVRIRRVRSPPVLRADDGILDFDLKPRPPTEAEIERLLKGDLVSQDDLLDWISRTQPESAVAPKASKPKTSRAVSSGQRYVDGPLVEEGVAGIKAGRFANSLKAAEALASRAEGTSTESTIDRLRRKIGKGLGE